jgi:uncharacterized protein YbbC (DUF1343 family)
VTDRDVLDAPEMGIELAVALRKLYLQSWKPDRMIEILANREVFNAVLEAEDPRTIWQGWQDDLEKFRELRTKYLLYR